MYTRCQLPCTRHCSEVLGKQLQQLLQQASARHPDLAPDIAQLQEQHSAAAAEQQLERLQLLAQASAVAGLCIHLQDLLKSIVLVYACEQHCSKLYFDRAEAASYAAQFCKLSQGSSYLQL